MGWGSGWASGRVSKRGTGRGEADGMQTKREAVQRGLSGNIGGLSEGLCLVTGCYLYSRFSYKLLLIYGICYGVLGVLLFSYNVLVILFISYNVFLIVSAAFSDRQKAKKIHRGQLYNGDKVTLDASFLSVKRYTGGIFLIVE